MFECLRERRSLTVSGSAAGRRFRRFTEPHEPIGIYYVNAIVTVRQPNEQAGQMKPFETIENPREIRRRLGLNQQEFWSRIGVTQSGGSRYESGRNMPKPVRELLRLVHVEKVDLGRVRGDDIEIAAHLKERNPGLYKDLKKAVRARKKN